VGAVAYYGYPLFKKSRADKFAAEAQGFIDKKAYPEAARKIQAALQIRPNDPRFLRLAARFFKEQRSAQALPYYNTLLRMPEATDADRYDFIELTLLMGRPQFSEQILKKLISSDSAPAKAYFYAALMTELQKDLPRAILFARAAAEKAPNERDYKYLVARLLLESTSQEDVSEGKKLLFAMAAKGDDGRPQAIRLLGSAQLTTQEIDQLVKWMHEIKAPTIGEYLLTAELLIKQDTNNLKTLSAKAIAQFKGGKPEDQIAVGGWLNRHKLYDEASRAISPEKDLKNQQLTLVYLDSLAGAEKWEELYKFVSREDLSLDPTALETLRASAATKLKKQDLAKIHWKKALALAGDQMDKVRTVSEVAERSEAYEDALVGFRRLATNAPTATMGQVAIMRIKGHSGDTKGVRDYVKEMVGKSKYDTAVQNYYAYLNLLLNEDVPNSKAMIEKLHLQNPRDLGFRTTLALARLRERNPDAAYGLFTNLNFSPTQLPSGARAVYAATLSAAKKDREAREVARTIQPKDLLPEEQALIKGLVAN